MIQQRMTFILYLPLYTICSPKISKITGYSGCCHTNSGWGFSWKAPTKLDKKAPRTQF